MKTFLDNCKVSDDFRLAVKRTRPKTLAEAVTAATQEECIRFTENRKLNPKTYPPQVYDVKIAQGDKHNREDKPTPTSNKTSKKCFKCNSTQHLIRDCPKGAVIIDPNRVAGPVLVRTRVLNKMSINS